jgi:CheY-like chemotaxis protein
MMPMPHTTSPALSQTRAGIQPVILIVDDEPDIQALMGRILRERGYSTVEACDGEEALTHFARLPISLVICNLRMPRLSGTVLFDLIQRVCPPLAERFLFCTGDIASKESLQFLSRTGRPYLFKPFEVSQFIELVEQTVQAPVFVDARLRMELLRLADGVGMPCRDNPRPIVVQRR